MELCVEEGSDEGDDMLWERMSKKLPLPTRSLEEICTACIDSLVSYFEFRRIKGILRGLLALGRATFCIGIKMASRIDPPLVHTFSLDLELWRLGVCILNASCWLHSLIPKNLE